MEETLERPLTSAQQARRQRVLDAAIELAEEGGYDAVQMRDVAARAEVAMGTVYRYFTSKDHLLAETQIYLAGQLQENLALQPARGETPSQRVMDVLERGLKTVNRRPELMTAVFISLASPDPAVVECHMQMIEMMDQIVLSAVGQPAPDDIADRSRMISRIWSSANAGWVNGRSTLDDIRHELRTAVRILLP
jgi:TetR/AcrR family transcriptional regulator, cholesterol catabolism regulator